MTESALPYIGLMLLAIGATFNQMGMLRTPRRPEFVVLALVSYIGAAVAFAVKAF